MLEMTKKVLQSVSFDRGLFKKELIKATNWLKREELTTLKAWCIVTFGATYGEVITDVLGTVS